MSQPTIEEVLGAVRALQPVAAKHVKGYLEASGQPHTRKEVNQVLYKLQRERRVKKSADDCPLWSLVDQPDPDRSPDVQSTASSYETIEPEEGSLPVPPAGSARRRARPKATRSRKPDKHQDAVIRLPVGARAIVEAGPGFGKTDVACARVARLIEEVPASQILLLSFTRTAVREMRARITELANSNADIGAVQIRTIDSYAWSFNKGLAEAGVSGLGQFEDSIQRSLDLLNREKDDDILEATLSNLSHVLVDEAQDMVGVRSDWVIAFLNRLPATSGWTVFMDAAQAIYGWADDGQANDEVSRHFVVDHVQLGDFEKKSLKTYYRSSNGDLRDFLVEVRERVPNGQDADSPTQLRGELLRAASAQAEARSETKTLEIATRIASHEENSLILFRSRGDALQASGMLTSEGVSHRLRLGGLPRLVAPWVAAIANHIGKAEFRESDFDTAWSALESMNPWLLQDWSREAAWRTLTRLSNLGSTSRRKSKRVKAQAVAAVIGRGQIPDELYGRELGQKGPVVGTIHGSKGREAEHVLCVIPVRSRTDETQEAEEERVLYVGVSRAKSRLEVCRGRKHGWRQAEGRAWKKTTKGRFLVEVGQEGDVDPFASLCAPGDAALTQQEFLTQFKGTPWKCKLQSRESSSGEWTKRVYCEGEALPDIPLAVFSDPCQKELGRIAGLAVGRDGGFCNSLYHLRVFDLTTVAMRSGDESRELPPGPFEQTHMWLQPVLTGTGLGFANSGKKSSARKRPSPGRKKSKKKGKRSD